MHGNKGFGFEELQTKYSQIPLKPTMWTRHRPQSRQARAEMTSGSFSSSVDVLAPG